MRYETVDKTSAAFIARHFGQQGRAWLATVPRAVQALTERWELGIAEPLHGGLLSCVFGVVLGSGERAVLKISGPWVRANDEAEALRAWNGVGAPRLLAWDPDQRALLLEAIRPGGHAADATATQLAALLRRLHIPPPPNLRPLAELVRERLDQAAEEGRSNTRRIAWARATAARLDRETPDQVMLHGDLDDRNLLRCGRRGLCAIDPLPCVGDPAYDAGYWVHSYGQKGRRARLDAIVEATGLPHARVRDWAAIVGVHG